MSSIIKRNKWQVFALIAMISIAIPILVVAFKIITTEEESVVFLEGYSTEAGLLILAYYVLLFSIGLVWLVKQLLAFIALKNETAKNELRHLQSQVNPHFFFNILNSLYGLVGKDAEKAQQLILKLSDLMRYSIYNGQNDLVFLAEEVEYLKNYIALHEMRYHKKIDIKTEIEIADEKLKIMPLMFIILVENAFKHGVERLRSNAFVHLKINASNDSLTFEVVNNFEPEEIPDEQGLGLKNLKRRLSLMYPKSHELTISQIANVYKVTLTLHQL